MIEDNYIIKDDALFHSKKHMTFCIKRILCLLEDLRKEHQINFDKLKKIFPENTDLIEMSNYFGEEKFAHIRKRVLDFGGDAIRNLETDIKQL